jgi:hypothetical protein
MRAIALALIALASLASVPASAQPYGGGWGYHEDGGRNLGPSRLRRGPRDYDRWDDGPPRSRQFHERRPAYSDRYGRQQRFGRMCVTARGNCPAPPGPPNTPCGCDIPGFEPKRGAIGF